MGVGDNTAVEAHTRSEADRRGWTFERMAGDVVLVRRLLDGDWENDFLTLEPNQQIVMTYNDQVIDNVISNPQDN